MEDKKGTLPVTENMQYATEGLIELSPEKIEELKDKEHHEKVLEKAMEIPNLIDKKTAEIPEETEEQVRFMVENNLLPESALDKFKTNEEVANNTDEAEVSPEAVTNGDEEFAPHMEEEPSIPVAMSRPNTISDDDFAPSMDEEEVEPVTANALSDYETVQATNDVSIFRKYIHDQEVLTKVENRKLSAITDPAEFEKLLNKARKKYRNKVSMPLVNSGILVDFIGAGAFDYTEIYSTDPDDSTLEDTLKRMKVMMNNIINVSPKIAPSDVIKTINYVDYQLASLGFAAATVPDVEFPATCECNTSFLIRTKTIDTILNSKELEDRWTTVDALPKEERIFRKDITVTLFDGYVEIYLTTPNFKRVKDGFTAIARMNDPKVSELATMIVNIDQIIIGDSIVKGEINIFKFLNTLTDEEITVIRDALEELYKDIVIPQFGVKANCPNCNKENVIKIGSVEEMVFFHLYMSRMLSLAKLAKKNTKNG